MFFKWLFLTAFLFAAVNWFFPMFPAVAHIVPALTIWQSAGAAGLLCAISLFF